VHQIELEMQNEELVKTRAEVEALLRQYTDLYNFAPAGYFTMARDATILQVNLAGAGLLGLERGALINRRLGVFISARSRATFNTFLENVFGNQRKETCEIEVQKDESTSLWVHIEATLKDGRECRAIVADITERKRAEQELKSSNEEMKLFTYTVSHDLKSPLVTIKTFLGYLVQNMLKQDAVSIDKDIGYISGAADKMSLLLDELLKFSRVGRTMNPSVEAPLQTIVKDALDLVAGQISARGVQVEVTEEPALLYGDRPRLVEVFQNLVDNAVKFMGDQAAPLVEIGVEPKGDEWVFFVRDNGIGIDPRHQGKVFGLFEKLNPDTEGNGIGLAMMRRIVEVHGGKIWLESAGSGKGTTFRFTLSKTKLQRT